MMTSQVEELKSFSRYLDAVDQPIASGETPLQNSNEKRVDIPEVPTGEVVASLLSVTFALIATKKGEHWNLAPDEAETAGDAYGAVIDKYFPDSIGNMGVEITALMVTAMLVTPRMMENAPLETEKIAPSASGENVTSIEEFKGFSESEKGGDKNGD